MRQHSTEQLNDLIRKAYSELDELKPVAVYVSQIGERVLLEIDPTEQAPSLVRWAAFLELKQLARAVCRLRQEQSERESESGNLFDFQLQPRYPAEREHDDAYVLREHLTIDERRKNVARLRAEASAKLAHADALEAETEHLIRTGRFIVADQSEAVAPRES